MDSPDTLTIEHFGVRFTVERHSTAVAVTRSDDGAHLAAVETPEPCGSVSDLEATAAAWFRDQAGANVPAAVRCAGCTDELAPVSAQPGLQYRDALIVRFDGAYGMYIDPVDGPVPPALLCATCVDELRAQVPWVNRILDAHT